MPRRRKWKWAAVLGTLFTGIVAPYIVEHWKGTPPDQIWGIIWHPFQLIIDWLAAPSQVSHASVLLLWSGLVLTLAALTGRWLMQRRSRKIPADFNPTAVQMLAIDWLVKAHGTPQSLSTLEDRAKPLTHQLGGGRILTAADGES